MVNVPKRVTLITRHTEFTITAKETLERDNQFAVTAFASALNALTFLQDVPQDIVIIDFTVRDMSGEKLITQIRAQQPDIGIIVSPNHPSVLNIVKDLNIQSTIDLPMPMRQLIKILNAAYAQMYQAQGDTNALSTLGNRLESATLLESSTLNLSDTQRTQALIDVPENNEQSEAIFRKLAAEEPPMPEFEESATVHDLITNMLALELNQNLSDVIQTEGHGLAETPILGEDSRRILATQILETAMDTSTPVNSVMTKLRERMSDNSLVESERWVREPDFLPDELLPLDGVEHLEYTSLTTTFNDPKIISTNTGDMDTDRIMPISRSRPIVDGDFPLLEDMVDSSTTSQNNSVLTEDALSPQEIFDDLPLHPNTTPSLTGEESSVVSTISEPETRVAQIALTLTEMSLETTADALILTQGDDILGYRGKIPLAELEEFRSQFTDAWTSTEQQTRIRFLNLPSSGLDYLLYSIRSDNNFTLSLLFAGMMPITAIRRQGKRLVEALASVPTPQTSVKPSPLEPIIASAVPLGEELQTVDERVDESFEKQVEDAIENIQELDADDAIELEAEPIPQIALKAYSFVWLMRDPDAQLSDKTALVLIKGLDMHLTRLGWKIYDVSVYEDFVYLRADAPLEYPPSQLIRDLMHYSADLAYSDNPKIDPKILWADSYLVIPSERAVNLEEIQDFINFARS